jgi:hypothetical protein
MLCQLGIFTYVPLSDIRNIRLLKILDGEGPIYCTLIEPAEETPSYFALSYTWGNPTAGLEHNS